MTDLVQHLDELAARSCTTKVWVDCLIKPVFIIMSYTTAERESNWVLHLSMVEAMIPLFFAAGHVIYSRYAFYDLHSVQDLLSDIIDKFNQGEHIMHHNPGILNSIWSDMGVESTFLRYGHSKSGIWDSSWSQRLWKPGLTVYISATAYWMTSVVWILVQGQQPSTHTWRKILLEFWVLQLIGRVSRPSLKHDTDPLCPTQHPEQGLVNTVTGQVYTQSLTNVDHSENLGKTQMEQFKKAGRMVFTYNDCCTEIHQSWKHRYHRHWS